MNDRRSGADPYSHLSKGTSTEGSRNVLIVGGAAIALVVILAAVAWFLTTGDGDGESSNEAVQEVAAIEVTGEALPDYPQVDGFVAPAEQDPAVGSTPPALSGEDFGGDEVTIDPADGRAKVIAFVTHWCGHCQAEVPRIQAWVDEGNLPDDVDLYAVSTGTTEQQGNYPPSEWLDREGWSEPVVLDDENSSAAVAWGLTAYPYLVFLDADGEVVGRATGQLPMGELDELVQRLR